MATLEDCCTSIGYESIKIKVTSGTPISTFKIVYGDIGFGFNCYTILALTSASQSISKTVTVYGDCTECLTENFGGVCPTPTPTPTPTNTPTPTTAPIRRLEPCCGDTGTPYLAVIPSQYTSGTIVGTNGLCYDIGAIEVGTVNVTFSYLYSLTEDCVNCTSEAQTTPCPTITPTPTQTSTPPVTQTKTPSPTPPVTQTKTPSSTPPVTPTRTASPVPITFEYYEVFEIPTASCAPGAGPFVMRTTNSYILGRYFNNGTCYEITDTATGPSFNFNYNGSTFVGCSGCFT